MKLIINADDFGMCNSVDDGIIYAKNSNAITSTTVMTTTHNVDETLKQYGKKLNGWTGVHLQINQGKPLTKIKYSSVITKDKHDNIVFTAKPDYSNINSEEIYKEFKAQIEKAKKYFDPTHLDSHYNVHLDKSLIDIVTSLALDYNLPLRTKDYSMTECLNGLSIKTPYITDFTWSITDNSYQGLINLINDLNNNYPDKVIEMIAHPGFNSVRLEKISSHNKNRAIELKSLIKLASDIKNNLISFDNLEFISYKEL